MQPYRFLATRKILTFWRKFCHFIFLNLKMAKKIQFQSLATIFLNSVTLTRVASPSLRTAVPRVQRKKGFWPSLFWIFLEFSKRSSSTSWSRTPAWSNWWRTAISAFHRRIRIADQAFSLTVRTTEKRFRTTHWHAKRKTQSQFFFLKENRFWTHS